MKRSIHFGLNEVDPNAYNNWNGYLNACVFDARDMAGIFSGGGYKAEAVFNDNATLARLDEEISEAASQLADGDSFVFSFSGHGGRAGTWAGGYFETQCLFDGQLADKALREKFARFKPGVRIVFISDSCHSGGLAKEGPGTGKARVKPTFVRSGLVLPSKGDIYVPGGAMLIAACLAEETAADGERNGAFSASLLHVWHRAIDESLGLTWDYWISATKRYMSENKADQHPYNERFGAEANWGVEVNT